MDYKPMKHQTFSLKVMDKSDIIFDMSDPGTGKTFVQIMAFAKRRKKSGGCAIVIAPKSLLRSAWEDDFGKFAPQISCSVAYAENREKAFAADADVYITNIDAVTWLLKQKPAFFKKFDTLIVDEVSSFKHHTSARSKALNKIRKYFRYRSVMSGTPNSNTICDIWNPVQILDDGKRLGSQFFGFRAAVCAPEQVGPLPNMVKWVDKDGSEEAIYGLIADITIRHKFEDCIDIPATHSYTMQYHLSAKQKKAYLEMEKTQIMSLKANTKVTAINAAAVTTKLLQIASGAVYENEDTYHVVDTGRYELVLDLVEDRKHPLVFFLWKHQRDELIKQAEKRGLTYCVMDGNASDRERTDMVKHYQAGFYDVMFAHPKSAAHGLTLTRGSTTIWASPTYDLEHFSQGNKRQARAGQKEKTEIIVILAEGTIEQKVYARLLEKDSKMTNLLSLFAEEKAA
ncbi:DEAD/DEAH box helicase [Herminiimonas sp. CN]|uniref:SNF2-related protein n=1 Tax=Herminiimonas sp. CN TaxID=1349818 RepID=UPI0004735B32|nr:DEAD/DEAH box helicase [Herminiimonas sp. CN]